MSYLPTSLCILILFGLLSCNGKPSTEQKTNQKPEISEDHSPQDKYAMAKSTYEANPDDPDALIWYGRRAAYLGNFEEAINIYGSGIEKHPEDARMYRHRGHRYISTRQYDKAIEDFEKAVTLIEGQEDKVEPDGLPNDRNIPISTLHGNIWYHLGLAYYLKNDMDNALRSYSNRTTTEKHDDNLVSGGHWLYMILSRLDRKEEAKAAIAEVHPEMDIIENHSYHKMCLFYKGLLEVSDIQPDDPTSSSANVYSYGLGNWYLYEQQDTAKAKEIYKELLVHGNKHSFAYLAAEADWERLFK